MVGPLSWFASLFEAHKSQLRFPVFSFETHKNAAHYCRLTKRW